MGKKHYEELLNTSCGNITKRDVIEHSLINSDISFEGRTTDNGIDAIKTVKNG